MGGALTPGDEAKLLLIDFSQCAETVCVIIHA